MRPPGRLVWLPRVALVMVVIFSAFALAYKPVAPDGEQHRLPLVQVAHYTAEDFFTSAR